MANPVIQVRIEPHILKRLEERARERGFEKPSGEVNMPAYFKFLGMEDLISKLDGDVPKYEVRKERKNSSK